MSAGKDAPSRNKIVCGRSCADRRAVADRNAGRNRDSAYARRRRRMGRQFFRRKGHMSSTFTGHRYLPAGPARFRHVRKLNVRTRFGRDRCARRALGDSRRFPVNWTRIDRIEYNRVECRYRAYVNCTRSSGRLYFFSFLFLNGRRKGF